MSKPGKYYWTWNILTSDTSFTLEIKAVFKASGKRFSGREAALLAIKRR